jgi:hypothetical protein
MDHQVDNYRAISYRFGARATLPKIVMLIECSMGNPAHYSRPVFPNLQFQSWWEYSSVHKRYRISLLSALRLFPGKAENESRLSPISRCDRRSCGVMIGDANDVGVDPTCKSITLRRGAIWATTANRI